MGGCTCDLHGRMLCWPCDPQDAHQADSALEHAELVSTRVSDMQATLADHERSLAAQSQSLANLSAIVASLSSQPVSLATSGASSQLAKAKAGPRRITPQLITTSAASGDKHSMEASAGSAALLRGVVLCCVGLILVLVLVWLPVSSWPALFTPRVLDSQRVAVLSRFVVCRLLPACTQVMSHVPLR